MPSLDFVPAVKAGLHARIGLIGPAGSGKTYTALRLAEALGATVGVIDTDRRRALLYADEFEFLHLPMHVYDPADLTRAVAVAADAGIGTLVVDTASAFWSGAEGMLEQVDRQTAAAGSSNKFGVGWNIMRPVERTMLDALAYYPGHVIVTLRAKCEYVVEIGGDGKARPRRIGTKPEQRDGIEGEFDLALDLDDAVGTVAKSRCRTLPRGTVIPQPGEGLAADVLAWLAADAQSAPFDPLPVRDWALQPQRTEEELHARMRELDVLGQLTATVTGENGEPMSLGKVLWLRRKQAREAAAAGGGQATT